MPVRIRRGLKAKLTNGLSAGAFAYFAIGPSFEGEVFERQTTEEERRTLWLRHRDSIIARFRTERPELAHLETWGETLERLGEASDAN